MVNNLGLLYRPSTGLDIGYVQPAVPNAFFRSSGQNAFFWSSGQFGPQQFILCWPAGPVAFDFFFNFFFFNLAHNAVNAR